MDLFIYDRDINLLGVIDKIDSLMWTRRFWSCGEFKMLLPFTDYNVTLLRERRLIRKKGDNQLGEIKYIGMKKNSQGTEEIEVQGKFITAWIGQRVIKNQVVAEQPAGNVIGRILDENVISPSDSARVISGISLDLAGDLPTSAISYMSEPFVNVLTACEDIAKASKIGFYLSTDIKSKSHTFKVYSGRDLTSKNLAGNPPCIFSQEFNNITEQEYTASVENLKTMAYVGGEEINNTPRKIVEVGSELSGLDRIEHFADAKEITQKYKNAAGAEVTMSAAQYNNVLLQRGAEEIEARQKNQAFSSKINPCGSLRYKRDFDVGDRVTCINKRWGIKIDVRVTEATEIYEPKGNRVEITFGENLPTLIDKIRQVI